MTAPDDVRVRVGTLSELPDVLNVLDNGGLETDVGRVRRALEDGDVLVAVAGDDADTGRVLGAVVLDGQEITAIAVRRRRRDQGIGTAFVEAASQRRDGLVAEFDAPVRPFWDSLGFAVESAAAPGRYRGVR